MGGVPEGPGSYVLILEMAIPVRQRIGHRGEYDFPAGFYLYCGSARGPGGLHARLDHHRRVSGRPHWHLDYLPPLAVGLEAWCLPSSRSHECEWAATLASEPGIVRSMAGFGASDCRCPGHLLYTAQRPLFEVFSARLAACSGNGGPFVQAALAAQR